MGSARIRLSVYFVTQSSFPKSLSILWTTGNEEKSLHEVLLQVGTGLCTCPGAVMTPAWPDTITTTRHDWHLGHEPLPRQSDWLWPHVHLQPMSSPSSRPHHSLPWNWAASRVSGGAFSSSRLMLATWRPQAQRPTTFCFGNFPSYRSSSAAAEIIWFGKYVTPWLTVFSLMFHLLMGRNLKQILFINLLKLMNYTYSCVISKFFQ